MKIALKEAEKAAQMGEVPVGAALIAPDGTLIARAGNRTRTDHDPTAHAEMLVIREGAQKLSNDRLLECDLYVTLEPCAMCAAAISHARIRRLYFGASDPKSGGIHHGARVFSHPQCHHAPEIYDGIDGAAAGVLLRDFFKGRR